MKKSILIEEIKSLHDNEYHPVDKIMPEWKQTNREIISIEIINDE